MVKIEYYLILFDQRIESRAVDQFPVVDILPVSHGVPCVVLTSYWLELSRATQLLGFGGQIDSKSI